MNIATQVPLAEIEYPECDGLPLADNSLQARFMMFIKIALDLLFKHEPDTFGAINLLWYPVEGNNLIRAAPDVFVVKGRPKGERGSYLQWREDGIAPQVVWEVLSPGNRAGEMQLKLEFYERYGVSEYYLYDPDRGTLRGWNRDGEELVEIERMHGWESPLLKVRLELHEGKLVLYAPNNERLLTHEELDDERQEALMRAAASDARARVSAAQAEAVQLAREQAEAATEHERAARAEAEARVARLAEKLRQLGINPEE